MRFNTRCYLAALLVWGCLSDSSGNAQSPIMPLGDSITQGGQGYASYRYPLWFDLLAGGYAVDFVGSQNALNAGSTPIPAFYPDYDTTFDRDHEGYWGWRTDEIANIILAITTQAAPDIVLIHLGTNDIGQMAGAGVTNADTNLRFIIGQIRSVRPNVAILLAQVTPIGPGTSYFKNADQVAPLNSAIATIVSDLDTPQSPIILVDQNTGFNLGTMVQSDGLHPNEIGEAQMSSVWLAALSTILTPGNIPPTVNITSPADGASFAAPASITIDADASDADGTITDVRFYEGATLLATDTTSPYSFDWIGVCTGAYTLTAVATDNDGEMRTSNPVSITVNGAGDTPIAVANASFEAPTLSDSTLASGPGLIGSWQFDGTANTFVGIFNPPSGSYPSAGGNAAPIGADGANVAFLFNNGGAAESVAASQTLATVLAADQDYTLTIAIGMFLPNQPYTFSEYGGYQIELLAGATVIASDVDSVVPLTGEFTDATAFVAAENIQPSLIGQALSIRITLPTTAAPRSTHFDNVRLIAAAGACNQMLDITTFVAVLTGIDNDPSNRCLADIDGNGLVDGRDITPYVDTAIACGGR